MEGGKRPHCLAHEIETLAERINAGLLLVPGHLRAALSAHIMFGEPTGDFLNAVLANDFASAACRADPVSTQGMRGIAMFLVDYAPATSWGSVILRDGWRRHHGALGARTPADDRSNTDTTGEKP